MLKNRGANSYSTWPISFIHHLIFHSSDSCDQNNHHDFSNVILCPSMAFMYFWRKPFFLSLTPLFNLLFFSQCAENRPGQKGLLFNWKHLETGSWAGGVQLRPVIMGFPHPWRMTIGAERHWWGFRGEADPQQPHHSSPSCVQYEVSGTTTAGKEGGVLAVSTTSEMGHPHHSRRDFVCLRLVVFLNCIFVDFISYMLKTGRDKFIEVKAGNIL